MMASRQKRKCCCCGTGYLREFGMVVEIRWLAGGSSLALAPCTDVDDKDLHALILQERFPDVNTAQELYDLIPMVVPQNSPFLRKAISPDFWNPSTFQEQGVYIYIYGIY